MNPQSKVKKDGLPTRRTSWVKRPNTSQTSDTALATAASEAIECLTTVPVETIHVTARHGWLHLGGTVNWEHQRITLEEVTRHLPGVRGLIDSMVVGAAVQ